MFDAVRFRSFKSLADVTLDLGRLTLLVGANASGKSSVLDGLHDLCRLAAPRSQDRDFTLYRAGRVFNEPHSPGRLRTWGREGSFRIEASSAGRLALAVEVSPEPEGQPTRAIVEFDDQEAAPARIELPAELALAIAFFRKLDGRNYGSSVRLQLEAKKVASFAADSAHPRVADDGLGTAAVIAWLAEQRSPALECIEADLRKMVPHARRIIPLRMEQPGQPSPGPLGRVFELELESGARVPADLLSEGTLLTIGLLTVLHQPPHPPRLVLLDDFDRALHPTAQKQLVACVKELLARHADLQFVCTTHSPYVLDLFDAADVRVLRADPEGHTCVRKLTDHPEWASWKDTMKAGEFWSYVGEDWLDVPAAAE